MMQRVKDHGLTVLGLVMAGFFIILGILVLSHVTGDLSTSSRLLYGPLWIAAGLVMLVGVYFLNRSPRLGAGLVSVAAVGMAIFMFWLFFILVPVAVIVITLAVMHVRRETGTTPEPAA